MISAERFDVSFSNSGDAGSVRAREACPHGNGQLLIPLVELLEKGERAINEVIN